MTKQYFKELAEFYLWATNIVCGWLEQIDDAQWNQEIISSFSSIQKTVLHIISAENTWLQRFNKAEKSVVLQNEFKGTKQEHINLWKKTSAEMKSFIESLNEDELNTNLDYKRANGEAYSMPFYQLIAHVVNHATYHRGQLVTMLRQTGCKNVSSTDLLEFYRKMQ